MHGLLQKLFAKRGIKDIKELDEEEKATFENWDKILSKEELTLEDVKRFCRTQCEIIENKWKDYGISQNKKAEWIVPHTIYKTLLLTIDSPRSARKQLEEQLLKLTK